MAQEMSVGIEVIAPPAEVVVIEKGRQFQEGD
jgi:hypothetical protein